ncbi:MAG: 30S ribosomal protein S6e [Candidatus Woesearchaeota archaeon]
MAIKANIGNPKDGKTQQFELDEDKSQALMGKKIGDKISGNQLGFDGYEFELVGGSDNGGFPMRRDAFGTARKKVLITGGVGLRAKRKGMRRRKTVAGNTVHDQTAQVNLKVAKQGKKPLGGEPEQAEGEKEASDEKKE